MEAIEVVKPVRRTNTKRFGPMNVDSICDCPGTYIILNRSLDPQYVGSSTNLRRRLQEHLAKKDIPDSRYFRTYQTRSSKEAKKLERQLYRKRKPYYNIQEPWMMWSSTCNDSEWEACENLSENLIRIYRTPQGPQVYFGDLRIHHWPMGLASAIIGVLGLIFDDNDDRRDYYTTLFLGGAIIFIDDLPDFITFIRGLQE